MKNLELHCALPWHPAVPAWCAAPDWHCSWAASVVLTCLNEFGLSSEVCVPNCGAAFLYITPSSTICSLCCCAVPEHFKSYLDSKGFALSRSRGAIQPCWISGRCFKYGKRLIQDTQWFCQKFFFSVSPLVYNLDWLQVINHILAWNTFCFDIESINLKVANLWSRWC